jgi:EmrB/QacA subfamily drug resistance transporter
MKAGVDVSIMPPPEVETTGVVAPPDDTPRPRRWLVFAIVGAALLMISIDQTSVATALVQLQADLGTSLAWSGWTITAYAVGQIVALPVAGRLSDQFGRKRVFLIAVVLFTFASLACGIAPGIGSLIASRLVQGLAGGAFLPSATGLVSEQFRRDRDRAVALFTSIIPIGAIIGPVVGGIIVTLAGWREIFLVNVPLGVLVFVAASIAVTETPRSRGGRVDVVGIALLVAMLLAGMLAVTLVGTRGAGWAGLAGAGAAALLAVTCGGLQLRHSRRHPAPLIPIALLRGRGFGAMNVVNVMFGSAALGMAALVPHYAEIRYDIAPLLAGGFLALRAVGMICTSGVAVVLIRRTGYRPLLLVGTGIHAVGLAVFALPPLALSPYAWLGVAAVVSGVGMGLAAPASNNAALHMAPDQLATVSGLRSMFRQSGGIVAVSVTTAVVSASSHPAVANAVAFAAFAVVMAATIPIALRVPNHRGRW